LEGKKGKTEKKERSWKARGFMFLLGMHLNSLWFVIYIIQEYTSDLLISRIFNAG
jgi:zona occludens toxin (predicted ATPase)